MGLSHWHNVVLRKSFIHLILAGYLIYWNFVSQTVFGERDCFQPIKWQEIRKQSLCSENSKIVSLLSEWISLSKETVCEFPAIWLVENSLFPWDFFKMHKEQKSQVIRNRPQDLVLLKILYLNTGNEFGKYKSNSTSCASKSMVVELKFQFWKRGIF